MRKVILSISALLCLLFQGINLHAQHTFTADLGLIFRDGPNHFTLDFGDSVDVGMTVVNHGPDDIDTSNFVLFSMTGIPPQYSLIVQKESGGLPIINNGDTVNSRGVRFIQSDTTITTEVTRDYCFFLRTNDDADSFIYDPNQSNDTVCFSVTFRPRPTSINEVTRNASLRISPNPATNMVNIPLDGLKHAAANLKISSVDGRLMHDEQVSANGVPRLSVDVSSWPKGIYFVNLQSEKIQSTGRFVVQ